MDAKDAITELVECAHTVTGTYLSDLSDEDLMARAVSNSNHIAWLVGHLVVNDHYVLSELGCTPPVLRDGFADAHASEKASSNDPDDFFTKAQYIEDMGNAKTAVLNAINALSNGYFDDTAPQTLQDQGSTKGNVLVSLGAHWLRHAGEFVAIRRALEKPVL